jgi:DNA-binding NarL/FixJ family response regulator
LRLKAAGRSWRLFRAIVSPLAGTVAPAFAFNLAQGQASDKPVERMRELDERLRQVLHDGRSAQVAAAFVDLPTTLELPAPGRLSPREYEILAQLNGGQRVPAIARQLFLSESTVRNHLTSVFRLFGVNSQQGLLDALREHQAVASQDVLSITERLQTDDTG